MQSSESVMGIARILSLEVDMDNGVYIVSTICLLSPFIARDTRIHPA